VKACYKNFTGLDLAVGILQIDRTRTDAFHLGAVQRDACFIFFIDKIVMICFFILGDYFGTAFILFFGVCFF
jgi:hypothetical protein